MSWCRKSSAPTTSQSRAITTITAPTAPTLRLINRQRRDPVPAAWLRHVAGCAMARLKIRQHGIFVIAFVDSRLMRRLNQDFAGHRGLTDVLSFRYDGEPIIGEVIVSPAFAQQYAAAHGLPYRQELARYALHGLLHWLGHDDRAPARRRRMRRMEDELLRACAAS